MGGADGSGQTAVRPDQAAAAGNAARGQESAAGEQTAERFSLKEGTAQREITERYQKAVDSVMSGTYGKSEAILMGYTPKIYHELGMPSLLFVIGPGHVYSIAKTEEEARAEGRYNENTNYHGMGEEAVKELYSKTHDPVMVIASKDEAGNKRRSRSKHSVVAIVDVGTAEKSLFLPVEITAERTVNGQQMDVNVLSSAYERNVFGLVKEAIAQENIGQTGVYYMTKKAEALIVDGVQYPKRLSEASASAGIVHRFQENVNMKIMDQTQSLQFKRWFGDWQNDPEHASKVVDAEGKPLVVYHTTWSEPFTAFDKSQLGENADENATDPALAANAHIGFWFNTQDPTGFGT